MIDLFTITPTVLKMECISHAAHGPLHNKKERLTLLPFKNLRNENSAQLLSVLQINYTSWQKTHGQLLKN